MNNSATCLFEVHIILAPSYWIQRSDVIYFSGAPVNSFEFLRPLLKSLDYDIPGATISVSRALFLGRVFTVIYTVLYPWLDRWWLPQPLILPAEVYKVSFLVERFLQHFFSLICCVLDEKDSWHSHCTIKCV